MLKRVIFAVDENELGDEEDPLAIVLERQISYFADKDGLDGLLKYLGDSPWCEVLEVLRDGFGEQPTQAILFVAECRSGFQRSYWWFDKFGSSEEAHSARGIST